MYMYVDVTFLPLPANMPEPHKDLLTVSTASLWPPLWRWMYTPSRKLVKERLRTKLRQILVLQKSNIHELLHGKYDKYLAIILQLLR